jgi:pimeloyl-ACP methyl ester carboxylesterase
MRINGVDLFVRRFGDPALPVLVIVHGGPTWDHSYLLPAVAELADVAHVVVFDLRGCGRSQRTAPAGDLPEDQLQPDLLADDVAALIRSLGSGPAGVLGFSYGGRIAMRVVEQHPEVVRRVILASTSAYTGFEDELRVSAEYRRRAEECPEVSFVVGGPDGALSRAMAYAGAPLQIWRLDRLEAWHRVLEQVRFSSDYNGPFAAGTLRPSAPADPVAVLREWGGPVLIVHGVHDMCFPIGVAQRLRGALPAAVLTEVPEAGHMTHFDNPGLWQAAIRRFLHT